MLQKSNETEVTVPLSGWSLRERPRTDSSCANFSLRVIRGCWSNAWCWVEVGMTFHVKNEETDHQRISLLIITRRNSVGTGTQIYNGYGFYFAKGIGVFFFWGGGIVVVEDDSTQRLRGNLCNEVAILIYSSVNWTSISKFWFNVLTQFNSIQRFAVFLISCPKSGIFGVFLYHVWM